MSAPTLLDGLWQASWQGSVLIVLVLLIQAALGRWLTPPWRYALWLVVVARLALPFTLPSQLSLFNLGSLIDAPGITAEQVVSVIRIERAPIETFLTPPAATAPPLPLAIDAPEPPSWTAAHLLLSIWLLGLVLFAARVIAVNLKMRRVLRALPPVTDLSLLDLLVTCRRQLGVRRPVRVVETDLVPGPALWGVLQPVILLPCGFASASGHAPEDLRWSLLHELAHVKRWDAAMNWLLIALQAVHWFNPLVWLAFHRLRGDREIACDALVLARSTGADPRRYGEAILRVLESAARSRRPGITIPMAESIGQLQRRLTMIARHRRTATWQTALGVALLLTLGCAGLTDRTQPPRTLVVAYEISNIVGEVPNAMEDRELDESAREIVKLIQETVDPENWRDAGGRVSSIREHNGVLIVTTTPRNHREIHRLLEQVREQRGIRVMYETRFFLVDPNFLDEIGVDLGELKGPKAQSAQAGGAYMNDVTVDFVIRAVKANRRYTLLPIQRITGFNGQRVYVLDSTQTAYINSIDKILAVHGAQPRAYRDGVIVEVQGTVSADRKHVTLDIHPRLAKLNRLEEKPAPETPPDQKLTIEVPHFDLWEAQRTVSVPDKGTLLMVLGTAAVTTDPKADVPVLGGRVPFVNRLTSNQPTVTEDRTILFMIKPTILEQTAHIR